MRRKPSKPITATWSTTMPHMDGSMALAFVRERTGGEQSRGVRQQAFFTAFMAKGLSAGVVTDPLRLASLLQATAADLTVDGGFTV
jgi:anionic cell wall polymer biosynthesis LytR-Cps2A-Psr (LCP) family protein